MHSFLQLNNLHFLGQDELGLARELDAESNETDEMIEFIEELQQNKLAQISELQACFASSGQNGEKKGEAVDRSCLLLSESFKVEAEGDEENLSDFEDLRL